MGGTYDYEDAGPGPRIVAEQVGRLADAVEALVGEIKSQRERTVDLNPPADVKPFPALLGYVLIDSENDVRLGSSSPEIARAMVADYSATDTFGPMRLVAVYDFPADLPEEG